MSAVKVEVDYTLPQCSKVSLDLDTFKTVEMLKTIVNGLSITRL
jgi:hypothetical protein